MATDLKPTPKVAAAGTAGVLDLPPEVAAGIVTVAAGYLMPDKKPKA